MPKLTRKEKRAINQAKFRAQRGGGHKYAHEAHLTPYGKQKWAKRSEDDKGRIDALYKERGRILDYLNGIMDPEREIRTPEAERKWYSMKDAFRENTKALKALGETVFMEGT